MLTAHYLSISYFFDCLIKELLTWKSMGKIDRIKKMKIYKKIFNDYP